MATLPSPQGVVTQLSVDGLIAITWAGAGVGTLFTSARIVIRIAYMKRLLVDDYFMLLALAFLITNAVLQTLQAPHLYYVVLNITGPDIVHHGLRYTHYEFAIIGIFWSVLWSVKASFLALFWMMSDGLPRYRRVWWATVVFTTLAYIGCWIGSVYTCHPPSNYFKFGKCTKPIDQKGSIISISYGAAVDILTDLLIMSLPLRILWETKINIQQKIGLVIVFSLGILIIAVAIVRTVQITGKAYSDQAALAVWSVVESSISIIVGCLPPFRAIISTTTSTTQFQCSSSSARPNSKDLNPSVLMNYQSNTASWSEPPLPLQEGGSYQRNPDYKTCARDVCISGGQRFEGSKKVHHSVSQEELGGDIKMTQEFSVVTSK